MYMSCADIQNRYHWLQNLVCVGPRFQFNFSFSGIITFYELWMRGVLKADGSRDPSDIRIFHPSGSYSPRPTISPQENPLEPPATNYTVYGLEKYTQYEFQVLSENAMGKAPSEWAVGRTMEASKQFSIFEIRIIMVERYGYIWNPYQ